MTLVDFHSHYPSRAGELVIQQDVDSIGIHPWYIEEENIEEVINILVNKLEHNDNKQIKAIGECGLDRLSTVPMEVQKKVFIKHVELSERFHLPLIIHCVKCMNELLVIRKLCNPTQPWIWHGFRGKPEKLKQLLRAGFYISFGIKYNKESLLACPLDRMFLETDDNNSYSVYKVYAQVANDLCITIEDLANKLLRLLADVSKNTTINVENVTVNSI